MPALFNPGSAYFLSLWVAGKTSSVFTEETARELVENNDGRESEHLILSDFLVEIAPVHLTMQSKEPFTNW
eukprot:CAMPEP_0175855340 /NCGR_PEP_ID=MMETSP0107_2-20121207/27876_1 /TAXON_ID=195067 ORGANISM="Goniomonas pacifica, Strain CCMP1869" /NCGR_SAMPLE_ID=MMETSP0107_2 /ASSEMBLY_ACC=CAM_ASM_000203 /LENGTH=70 /DNA_ID=CAMNT_0017171299 /DNA_START=197 /DNA_END=409 /DNA_ORIENTATION=+